MKVPSWFSSMLSLLQYTEYSLHGSMVTWNGNDIKLESKRLKNGKKTIMNWIRTWNKNTVDQLLK